jgi:broad specificity phosphatase PhoE
VTATLYLIRHAPHDHLGHILSGRAPGIPLSDAGRGQARRLARALAERRLAGVWSSPVQRARETAKEIALGRGVDVQVEAALDEIDFGTWTGKPFEALAGDGEWGKWNSARGKARPPSGESMAEVQARITDFARTIAALHPDEAIALVSHCDVIRAALAGWLGLPLDNALNFDVDPASVSRVAIGDWGARVLSINEALA